MIDIVTPRKHKHMTSFEKKRNKTLPGLNFFLIITITISSNVIGAWNGDNDGENDDEEEK